MSLSNVPIPISIKVEPGNADPAKSFDSVKDQIKAEFANLTPEARQRTLDDLDSQIKDIAREQAEKQARREHLTRHIEAMDAIIEFFNVEAGLVLENNTCSRLHHLKDGKVYGADSEAPLEKSESLRHVQHTFVVKHDWARAFETAEGVEDGIRLPYEICAFEFRINGKTIIAIAAEDDTRAAGDRIRFHAFMHAIEGSWYSIGGEKNGEEPVVNFMWNQIRAICIALDSEVATHEVQRAPTKLNEKRTRSGKSPLADFHVIDLARRHRISNPCAGSETGRRVRLHFRRGHWRHYDDHRTWIKWMLVGNPDLGFIQKHYSL